MQEMYQVWLHDLRGPLISSSEGLARSLSGDYRWRGDIVFPTFLAFFAVLETKKSSTWLLERVMHFDHSSTSMNAEMERKSARHPRAACPVLDTGAGIQPRGPPGFPRTRE